MCTRAHVRTSPVIVRTCAVVLHMNTHMPNIQTNKRMHEEALNRHVAKLESPNLITKQFKLMEFVTKLNEPHMRNRKKETEKSQFTHINCQSQFTHACSFVRMYA